MRAVIARRKSSVFLEWLIMALVCYLDDSGEKNEPVQTLAGLIGTRESWVEFEAVARRAFDLIELKTRHTVDMHQRRGEFGGWNSTETAQFANDFFKIVRTYAGFGIEASVLKRTFKAGKETFALKREGSPIGMCFRIILDRIVKDAGFLDAEQIDGVNLSFVVENGHKNNGEMLDRFNIIKAMDPNRFGSLTFEDKSERIALQAADFLAYFSRRIRTATLERPRDTDKRFFLTAIGDFKFKPFLATEFGV